jgi:excisionase family DNA binding protein
LLESAALGIFLLMAINDHHAAKYATMKEEAARTGFSERQFHRLVKTRKVPAFKVGRKVLLRPSEVDAALDKFRIGALSEKTKLRA